MATGVDLDSFLAEVYIAFSEGLTLPRWVESGVSNRSENRREIAGANGLGPETLAWDSSHPLRSRNSLQSPQAVAKRRGLRASDVGPMALAFVCFGSFDGLSRR